MSPVFNNRLLRHSCSGKEKAAPASQVTRGRGRAAEIAPLMADQLTGPVFVSSLCSMMEASITPLLLMSNSVLEGKLQTPLLLEVTEARGTKNTEYGNAFPSKLSY